MFPQEGESIPLEQPESLSDRSGILKYVVLVAAAIYVIASLYLVYSMRTHIAGLEQKQQVLEAQQAELGQKLHAASSELKQQLSMDLGTTKQEMAARAEELEKEQKAAAAKLSAAQSQQGKQLAAVSGEVTNVKTDVGAAKSDIQKTQTDLAATNSKLEHAMGDLGVQSGLIAHNASELEMLKRKGERNYYEFTLQKGAKTPVSTVSLQLKKVDPNKSKFSMNVIADDKTIEKKDRTLNEPLQFYTGRDHMLYELVVFTAKKNVVTGYLSTPKTAPTPITP
jgi:chromosome segregation ATPase